MDYTDLILNCDSADLMIALIFSSEDQSVDNLQVEISEIK
jgi:hypothetical protein